jgi:hypothetical protein
MNQEDVKERMDYLLEVSNCVACLSNARENMKRIGIEGSYIHSVDMCIKNVTRGLEKIFNEDEN